MAAETFTVIKDTMAEDRRIRVLKLTSPDYRITVFYEGEWENLDMQKRVLSTSADVRPMSGSDAALIGLSMRPDGTWEIYVQDPRLSFIPERELPEAIRLLQETQEQMEAVKKALEGKMPWEKAETRGTK